jgi:hypothetical protein
VDARQRLSAIAGLLLVPLLMISVGADTTAAAFSGKLVNQTNRFAAAPDLVPPTVDRTVIAFSGGGAPGYVAAGRPYRVYALADDTGNPASGVGPVTADVSQITAGATAAVLTPGTFTVAGLTYNFRSYELIADARLPDGHTFWMLYAADEAGNGMVPQLSTVHADSTAPVIAATTMHAEEDESHHIYAAVDDGPDGSGVASVTARASSTGDEALPMSSAGGPWVVDGVEYNYRTVTSLAPDQGDNTFSVTAVDAAGNASDGSGTYFGGVPAPTALSFGGSCTTTTVAQRGTPTTYLNDHAKSGANGFRLDVPAGVQNGDWLVVNFTAVNRNKGAVIVDAPAGWTLAYQRSQHVANINTDMLMQTYMRKATLPEPASYTWDFVDVSIAGGMVAFSGVDPDSPVADVSIAHGFGSSGVAPSVTPGVENAMLLGFAGMNSKNKATWTGHTMAHTVWNVNQHGSGNHQSISGAARESVTAPGPTGSRSWTASHAEPYIVSLMALAPRRTATIIVSWTGTTSAQEYQVVRQGGGQGTQTWTVPAGAPGATVSLTDTDRQPDTTYTYYVRAVENGQQSDPLEGTTSVSGCTAS